jgi:RimJ/RimL family protein N-acetyltransferase
METYPKEWERHLTMAEGRAVYVRPIRPDDERFYGAFLAAETPEDLRRRFLSPVKDLSPAFISRFTHIDHAKAMAFIALDEATGEMLGVARLHRTAQSDRGEYAVIVRSDVKGHGLGRQLMQMIIAYARSKDFHCIEGQVLRDNTAMLNMCEKFGFVIRSNPEAPYICDVKLSLSG